MIGAAFEHIFLRVVDNHLRDSLAAADAHGVPAALQLGNRVRRQTVPLVVETIVRPPGLPVTINSRPSLARMVGDMLESIRLPGSARLAFVPTSPSAVVSS